MTCEHHNTTTEVLDSGPHYARENCRDCGKFLRWLKKPETLQREMAIAQRLAALRHKDLNEWECEFVDSLSKQDRLSPKQLARLDELARAFGVE